ncbi:MAG: hypothetical protein U0T11_08740 [Chitinophagaceae bacterium]
MKQIVTICLLLLFLVFQYGKIIEYSTCKLTAIVNQQPSCDCEKIITATTHNNPAPVLPQHMHIKLFSDEYKEQSLTSETNLYWSEVSSPSTPYSNSYSFVFVTGIFHPPLYA